MASAKNGTGARPQERGCAVVTGASGGIGAEIARQLAYDGWAVVVSYLSNAQAATAVVDGIREDGGRAVEFKGDVRDPATPAALIKAAREEFELPVLALVNNAGTAHDALVPRLSDYEWDDVIETNLSATYRMSKAVLRGMMRARFGRIVNITSTAESVSYPGQAAYSASKAGVSAFTRTLAQEVARLSITANIVSPGLIGANASPEVRSKVVAQTPAERVGTPQEVAACVRFLVSEEASFVTGARLVVDGGLTL